MRILVTGSRDWNDLGAVERALLTEYRHYVWVRDFRESFTVIHGGCPSGADLLASRIALTQEWDVEAHFANWVKHGKAAGPIRNQAMVDAGADTCLAFLMPCNKSGCRIAEPHDSHGTADCVERAKAAGITVREYRQ